MRDKKPLPFASPSPGVVGWVDGPMQGRLHGWASDRSAPFRRLTVAAVDSWDHQVAVALADRYRADVQKSGIGDGHYGFALSLDRLAEKGPLRIVCNHRDLPAAGVEISMVNLSSSPVVPRAKAHDVNHGTVVLHVDGSAAAHHVQGWARDMSRPDRRRIIQLKAGDQVIARQRATLYRADIVDVSCDGFHGFRFSQPCGLTAFDLEDIESGLIYPVRRRRGLYENRARRSTFFK